jgi:hypothetical protein
MEFTLLPNPAELGFPEINRVIAERNIFELIQLVLKYAQLALLLLIIFAGIQWMFSLGNAEKISNARATIVSAVVGYVIIVFALPVVSGIASFFQK